MSQVDAPAPARPRVTMSTRAIVDVVVLTILSTIGVIGFATAFQDEGWLLAGLGGLFVGTAAALGAHFLRLGALTTMILALVAFFVFGSAFAAPHAALLGFIPTPDSLASLTIGSVFGWADILTLRAPVSLPEYVTAVPFVATWLVGVVTATLAARWLPPRRRTAWRAGMLLIGPLVLYVVGVLFGTEEPFFAAIRGISFAALALVWLGWRHTTSQKISANGNRILLRNKLVGTSVLVLSAILVGVVGGGLLAPQSDNRFVLREEVQPPFEPLNYPSPFSAFRKYTKTLEQTTLFTVSGLTAGQKLRLATLDTYDGIIWGVAGSSVASDGSGSFSLVGRNFPKAPLVTVGDTTKLSVTIADYADVWIPDIGYISSLQFADDDSSDAAEALRYNPATGTAVLTTGLRAGDSFTMTARLQKEFTTDELIDVPVANVVLPPVTNIPDVVTAKAKELAGTATTPIEQLRAIESALQTTGYLSHGAGGESANSRAGHGADRMIELITREPFIGDEEQYASAFALMARSFNYPARVVMGFDPKVSAAGGDVKVLGSHVTAWVEVAFEGVGWVPFYPTPDDTNIPQDQNPKPQSEPQPQVRQPPRTENDPNDLVAGVDIDDSDKDDEWFLQIPGWVWVVAASLLIPAALLFIPLLIIGLIKSRRMTKRRTAARGDVAAAGAWDELVDRFSELGYDVPTNLTRKNVAVDLQGQVGDDGSGLATIAREADEVVFSGQEIDEQRTSVLWTEAMAAVQLASAAVSSWRRLLARYRVSTARAWLSALTQRAAAEAEKLPTRKPRA
ncbi:MAG: transglutaminaseTgpA domain-containing protein [Microbacteriaceae bacterium]